MQLKESIVLRSSRFTGSGSEVCGIAVLTGIGDTVGCVVSMAAFFSASVCVALPGGDVGSSGSAGVGVGFSVGLGVGVESSGWSCKIRPMFWFGIPHAVFPSRTISSSVGAASMLEIMPAVSFLNAFSLRSTFALSSKFTFPHSVTSYCPRSVPSVDSNLTR